MRTINTTGGPVEVDPTRPGHVVNTSAVTEEDMQYLDEEPEILAVLPGGAYHAVVDGEGSLSRIPLVAFVALDDGRMHGVAIGEDGKIDLTKDVEKLPGFTGYKQTNDIEEK